VPSVTPQQSTRGFVAPSSAPIKKTPDISDVIGAEEQKSRRAEKENTLNPYSQKAPLVAAQQNTLNPDLIKAPLVAKGDEEEINSPSNVEGVPEERGSLQEITPQRNFPEIWRAMFEHVFASVPTIYYPLKETLPEIENSIIKIIVKNDVQKEHFEAKIRDVLEFLKNRYPEHVENIIVETNEKLETKKIIYDVKDKLQNFKEQNVEFDEFLQILDLKIKE